MHYDLFGWQEGRLPSLAFDQQSYLINNPGLAASGINPLAHFLRFGGEAGTGNPATLVSGAVNTAGFDATFYLLNNPDVAAAGVDPYQHFQTFGWKEGRNPNAFFDTKGYLATYTDVGTAASTRSIITTPPAGTRGAIRRLASTPPGISTPIRT